MPTGDHMTPEEFREAGHAMIDWIAEYMQQVEEFPVASRVEPGEVRAMLPAHPPEQGEPWSEIAADIDRVVMPGITHWQSPNFFGYFSSNSSGPSILGDLLSTGLGVQGMLWATSPACTELETHVLDWLVDILGLPAAFASDSKGGGVIQDTASSATLAAILTARERATDWLSNAEGSKGPLVAYTSSQAHSSIEKSAMVAGIGKNNVRMIDVDSAFAMRPQALAEAITADRAAGRTPFFVCASLGTTSSHAFDPLASIAEITQREGLWLHTDAAEAGAMLACPEFRHLAEGMEAADSFCFNPHKHLLTNFDCDAYFVRDREALIRTMSVLPEYLKNEQTMAGKVIDYRDWHVPLGRRFRALKLWFVIRHYGVEGLRSYLREHVRMAQLFASWVDQDPDFEIFAPHPLTLICFRHRSDDATNRELMQRLNDSGELFLTHTVLNDQFILRMAIGGAKTTESHVRRAWEKIRAMATELST